MPTVKFQPTPTSQRQCRWMADEAVPEEALEQIQQYSAVIVTDQQSEKDGRLFLAGEGDDKQSLSAWVFVPVMRFFSVRDAISSDDLNEAVSGGNSQIHVMADIRDEKTLRWLYKDLPNIAIDFLEAGQLQPAAWEDPSAVILLPFHHLDARWKVLLLDGADPFSPDFDPLAYPLTVRIASESVDPGCDASLFLPLGNYSPQDLLSLRMTGVTALVRKTAGLMNEKGVLYPADDIGAFLSSADLTHISNEVSFDHACTALRATSAELKFCAPDSYLDLLIHIGADIIELTGNHNLDNGEEGYLESLALYREHGMQVYGGGESEREANSPLLVEYGLNKLAFLGCNEAGPAHAWAGPQSPGAARCDLTVLTARVRELAEQGYNPIVTLQSFETDDYMPAPMQKPNDYLALSEAGAVVVSGSQAHFPQGFKFVGDRMIHYGLGNLFFDQMAPPALRRAFIDTHYFYRGRYINTRLTTTKLEEYGRPRFMNEAEREAFLTTVFQRSGW